MYDDITCKHGFYPYCPLCPYGAEIQEEWMREHECKWVCFLDEEKEEK